jgi:hypothetical protein
VGGRYAALAAATALASSVACGSSGAQTRTAHATALARCAPAGARIIKTDSRAQVYSLNKLVYGCDRRTRRSTKLGNATLCIGIVRVDHVALSADVVAYGADHCGIDTGSWIGSDRSIIGKGSRIEVAAGRRGRRSTLDSGPGIVASSLHLSGSTLSWRHGTAARTASL